MATAHSLCSPIPGGSKFRIEVERDEHFDVYLPPVGFTIDRIPNPKTGKASFRLIKCEILFSQKPVERQKWQRTPLPKEWRKWRKEEEQRKRTVDPNYVHPQANQFRQQEWRRRINGLWIAIGNKKGQPTEYVYLTGFAYFFLNWWQQDFGYPRFRFVLLKIFYPLQYAEDHLRLFGVTLSSCRRVGKTSVLMAWKCDYATRVKHARSGMQAQNRTDAREKFENSLVYGWKRLPDFFRPVFDYNAGLATEIRFKLPTPQGKNFIEEFFDENDDTLHSNINYRETKGQPPYDGKKLHRYGIEEPGKWEENDVYKTLRAHIPSMKDGPKKIGLCFAPTTIEEIEKGGDNFIQMFEDSFPSLMKKNENKLTTSGLIAVFIPGYEGYIYDEYGRSVVDDPAPNEEVYDEEGERVLKGAKTRIMEDRRAFANNTQKLALEIRKYPFNWQEAKMVADQDSPFNLQILTDRLTKLSLLPHNLYIYGNFSWVDRRDGAVEFVRDDLNGRWALSMILDKEGGVFEDSNKVLNQVGIEYYDGRKMFFPKMNRLFCIGADPIQFTKTDDPRRSKAAAYVFYKYDPSIDSKRPRNEWKSYNFIGEYLYRPDEFEVYGEDMIMACRYFGCSILAEDDVKSLKQHFQGRGYGQFLIVRSDFSDDVLAIPKANMDAYKGVEHNDEVSDAGVRWTQSFVIRHGHRMVFDRQINQLVKFRSKERTKFDAAVATFYTGLAAQALVEHEPHQELDVEAAFPLYDVDGYKSVELSPN